jgi:gluconolactonase
MTIRLILATSLLFFGAHGAEIPAPTGDSIVDPGAKLELLFRRESPIEGGLTEGPAVGPDGAIYFSDIRRGEGPGVIHRFDPGTGETTIFAENSHKSNGLIFGPDQKLYTAEGADHGGRRISQWDIQSKQRTLVVDNIGGMRFNSPNDICVDSKGRLYFSDPRYTGHEPRELEHRAVYRTTTSGDVVELTHDLTKPNGVALSPDEKTLYVAENNNGSDGMPGFEPGNPGLMRIYGFPLGPDGLVSGPRRLVYDFGALGGCDGMTVDDQGNLYLATREPTRPGILVLDPQGGEVAFIPTGAGTTEENPVASGLPSNVEFGLGDDATALYITVDVSLYRIRLKARGYHRQHQ